MLAWNFGRAKLSPLNLATALPMFDAQIPSTAYSSPGSGNICALPAVGMTPEGTKYGTSRVERSI
jgi:hypothetical protein